MVSNLKSELQNLKLEVSKLMNKDKDSDTKSYSSRKMPMRAEEDDLDSENISLSGYSKELSDKTQLRNLKNKYNATKQDLRQKCEALEKKN